jgi:hypothetical protein
MPSRLIRIHSYTHQHVLGNFSNPNAHAHHRGGSYTNPDTPSHAQPNTYADTRKRGRRLCYH